MTLLYGNRTTSSVMFAEELADLKDAHHGQLDLIHVLSREPRDVELFSGRLDGDRLRELLTRRRPGRRHGPRLALRAVRHADRGPGGARELGVPAERVHFELFWVDEPPPQLRHADRVVEGVTSEVTVILDGRSTTTPMPRDKTLLDAAQEVRTDLPFACKGGVCGTCRAKVRDGEVDMVRNYALEPDEVAARLRPHLPDVPGQRRGHRGLRRMSAPLLVEEHDDRVVLRLNRPEVRNAIDLAMVEALHDACAALEAAPRVALLIGSGGTFAAGADIAQLRERRRDDALAGHQLRHLRPDPPAADAGRSRSSTGTPSAAARSSRTPATSGSAPPRPGSATPSRASASSPRPAPPGG